MECTIQKHGTVQFSSKLIVDEKMIFWDVQNAAFITKLDSNFYRKISIKTYGLSKRQFFCERLIVISNVQISKKEFGRFGYFRHLCFKFVTFEITAISEIIQVSKIWCFTLLCDFVSDGNYGFGNFRKRKFERTALSNWQSLFLFLLVLSWNILFNWILFIH